MTKQNIITHKAGLKLSLSVNALMCFILFAREHPLYFFFLRNSTISFHPDAKRGMQICIIG